MSKSNLFAGVVAIVVLAAACGPSKQHGNTGGGGDDDGSSSADASACATENIKAEQVPLDLFIMFDQSSSMSDGVAGGGTKWSAVTSAITTFVQQPNLDGVSVGLEYFGLPPGGQSCTAVFCSTNADCGASACGPCVLNACIGALNSSGDSCTAADYAHADVEIAPLPGVGAAITASMSHHSPTTSTPTSAALQGAIDHATAWAHAHVGDVVAVVLATDGDPTECDTTLADINAIAAAGAAAMPKILTFVIGVGSSLASLNGIAAAGGTSAAFLVDTGGNVNQQFVDAMNAIRGAALGCQYHIPAPANGGAPNYQEVNVVFTPTTGAPQTFPYVMDKAHCPAMGNGWYYDDPANPTLIELCDATCTAVQADATGEVDISLGCSTVIL